MKSISLLINRIDLDIKPILSKVRVPYNGKLTTFEILGFLEGKGEPMTPYSLGKKLECRHLSFSQTMQFLNRYFHDPSDAILEPYQVTMKIAQDCPDIYNARKEIMMLTNAYAIRNNGKLKIGNRPIVTEMNDMDEELRDKRIFFYDGEFEAEDIGDEVSFLDKNFWPASNGNQLKRPTISVRSEIANISPVCVYFRDEKVQIHTEWLADAPAGMIQLPFVRKIE